ncbi:hypothetical protein BDB00DRAFT_981636, partial [Zychaea mexicana]|uniref:uncharacterized protein n=1 Tax=Zychaea mexicana TaxID=64656 RepID=UPI0022FE22EE
LTLCSHQHSHQPPLLRSFSGRACLFRSFTCFFLLSSFSLLLFLILFTSFSYFLSPFLGLCVHASIENTKGPFSLFVLLPAHALSLSLSLHIHTYAYQYTSPTEILACECPLSTYNLPVHSSSQLCALTQSLS